VWSDRFELGLNEFHKLDEVVTAPIAGRIDPVILFIEGQPKRREKYGATGLLLLAIPKIYSMERKKFDDAGRLIAEALDIDPEDAMVLAWAAHWHMTGVAQGWTEQSDAALTIAEDLCLRAIQRDPENAEAFGIYAHLCAWKRDFDNALHYFDRALRLNPNLAFVWALSAATHCYIGDPDGALKRMDRYRELAPFDPYLSYYETLDAVAHALMGDYKSAVAIGRRVTKVNPTFTNGYKTLIASLGHLDAVEEARPYVEKLLELEPNFTIERFGQVYPFKKEIDRENFKSGLRAAGVPEG
jgi:tetratricopeptide (TPR) repeat protein